MRRRWVRDNNVIQLRVSRRDRRRLSRSLGIRTPIIGWPIVVACFILAAVLGLGAAYVNRAPDRIAGAPELRSDILWNEVQPARRAVEDPADREWAARAEQPMGVPVATEPGAASSGGGERVSFGFCHVGGGTNCVVDGDTFYLNGQKIRIAGIDAPETHDYRCAAEKALGDRATRRLQELLNSGPVSLSRIDRDEDVYGRKLRNVAVNGVDVGDSLVGEELVREYRGYKMGWC